MDWLSIISLIGGFIMTGMGIYLTIKARTEPYRQTLYSKQLEGYVELYRTINDAYLDAINFVEAEGGKTEKRLELQLQTMEKLVALYDKYWDWVGILPEEVSELISNFVEKFDEILDTAVDSDTEKQFTLAYLVIINKMREIIGTDSLTEETINIIERYPVTRRKNQ